MQENIEIRYTKLASAVDVDGFKDVLLDTLEEQGSTPTASILQVNPYTLDGNNFRIVWTGSYSFQTPDGYRTFSESGLRVEVEVKELDYNALMVFLGARSKVMAEAYRDSVRGIHNLAADIAAGSYGGNVPNDAEYIRDTLEAALNEFPNSN
jgi:hypothetical protein